MPQAAQKQYTSREPYNTLRHCNHHTVSSSSRSNQPVTLTKTMGGTCTVRQSKARDLVQIASSTQQNQARSTNTVTLTPIMAPTSNTIKATELQSRPPKQHVRTRTVWLRRHHNTLLCRVASESTNPTTTMHSTEIN